jgi:threonine/homoserine/homoserine lactone efflux protein
MLTFLVLGAGIGFVAGVSPGPVLTLVVAETLRAGWLRGAAIAAGPLLADGPIIVIAFLVVRQLPPEILRTISLLGGAYLLYLAASTFLNGRQAAPVSGQRMPAWGGFSRGLLARILSPNPYLFWFLVGAPLLIEASGEHWLGAAAFLVGYYSTIVGSNVALALLVYRCMRLFSERVYLGIVLAASAVLGAYGLGLLGRAVAADR